ncbi:MAG: O-antigen ligase family protein, partial [Myxococcales bacterium]|nr:O-antigen ligase family protein [Myxococcales bacterium]
GFLTLLGLVLFASTAQSLEWTPVVWTVWPVAAWALLQVLGRDVVEWEDVARWCGGLRPFSTLGHPTQLGVWMAGLCVLAVDLARRRRSVPFLVTGAVAAMTCVATLSRAGWLALGVGLVGYAVAVGGFRRRELGVAGLGLGAIVLLVAWLVGFGALGERVLNAFVAPTRLALWKTSLAGFSEHPVFGWGFDTFQLVDQQLRQPEAWKYEWGTTAGHAHSFPAQVLATQGLVGVVLLSLAIAIVLRQWWSARIARERPAELAVVLALSAASLVTFHGVLTSALLLVGVMRTLSTPWSAPLPRWLRVLPIPVVLLVGVMLVASMAASRASRTEGAESTAWLDRAASLEPWSPTWPALVGASFEATNQLEPARVAYERSVARAPRLAVSHANVGRVTSRVSDGPASVAAFERARRLAPLDARIALDAAEASLRLGDLELAAATLESVVLLYPSDGPAWLTLGRVRVLQHRRTEARAMLQTSLEMDWRDWPEGLGQARALLAAVLVEQGDVESARDVSSGASVAALPDEVCGAPVRLR